MRLSRFAIGFRFNRPMFRLDNYKGMIVDEILEYCAQTPKFGSTFFPLVSHDTGNMAQAHVSLYDKEQNNVLSFSGNEVIYKKAAFGKSAVNIDSVLEEMEQFWSIGTKIARFKTVRRIGLVGEYRFRPEDGLNTTSHLVSKLTNLESPSDGAGFKLTYETRKKVTEPTSTHNRINVLADEYWNTIVNFYPSELDELGDEKGAININLDVQRYFAPAKLEPIKEIKAVRSYFSKEKETLFSKMKSLGLTN